MQTVALACPDEAIAAEFPQPQSTDIALPGRPAIPVTVLAERSFLAPRQAGSPNEAIGGPEA
jgi:hypothetical protein